MGEKHNDLPRIEPITITLRVFLIIFAVFGILFSFLTIGGCEYFRYLPRIPPENLEDLREGLAINITVAYVGLQKYNPLIEGTTDFGGCRDITDDFEELSWQFECAKVVGIIAPILGIIGCVLLLIDFLLCRFPASRLLVTIIFFFAFVCQVLTNLVYTAKVCEPNYVNGPYPCSPEKDTWYSATSTVLYLLCAAFACCLSKPLPLCMRIKKAWKKDRSDGCCVMCKKKDKDVEEETEEEEPEKDFEDMTPQEQEAFVEKQKTHAMVTTALASARRGKLEEIEKQLQMLRKYKEYMPEEEYDEQVAALMAALPKPETYDAYTKTNELVVLKEEGVEEEEEEEGEPEEEKKSRMAAAGAAIAGGAAATVGFVKRPFQGKKKAEEGDEIYDVESEQPPAPDDEPPPPDIFDA